jgi:hypothetical protein
MNNLVEHYKVDVEFPDVSGAEHLEMLQHRDKLFEIESTLSVEEKTALVAADRRLVEQAVAFYTELSRFIDFEQRRRTEQIPAARWWWYLDVLVQLSSLWFLEKKDVASQELARIET